MVDREAEFLKERYDGKRCLLLGGSGMLGLHVAEQLVALGACVTVLDKSHSRRLPESVQFRCVDLNLMPLNLLQVIGRDGYVFHLAAKIAGIGFNERSHLTMAMENLRLAANVIGFVPPSARYVYISSACIYPADTAIPTLEIEGWHDLPEASSAGYGWAKRMGERLAMWAADEQGLKSLVLRPSNLYSPRVRFGDPHAHVIPTLTHRVLSGEDPIIVRGSGMAQRSFLYAADAAKGLLLAAATDHVGTLNLAASPDSEVSIRDLVPMICDVCGTQPRIEWDDSKSDGYTRRLLSSERFDAVLSKHGLHWRPEISLIDGLAEVADACREFIIVQAEPQSIRTPARPTPPPNREARDGSTKASQVRTSPPPPPSCSKIKG